MLTHPPRSEFIAPACACVVLPEDVLPLMRLLATISTWPTVDDDVSPSPDGAVQPRLPIVLLENPLTLLVLYVRARVCAARTSRVFVWNPGLRLLPQLKMVGPHAALPKIVSDCRIVVTLNPRVAPPMKTGVVRLTPSVERIAWPFWLRQNPAVFPLMPVGVSGSQALSDSL